MEWTPANDLSQNCSGNFLAQDACLEQEEDSVGNMNVAGFVFMILVEVTALSANLIVIVIVLATAVLRENTTYIFVLSLAFTDLLASVTVVPLSLAAYRTSSWTLTDEACVIQGFLATFCMAMSIFSICAISVERVYFIKWPMHYAAHMNMKKGVGAMLAVTSVALILAVCPLLGWGGYEYDELKTYCTFLPNTSYIITVGVLCFVLPGSVTVCMYYVIYRVAKRTACQVQPSLSIVVAPDSTVFPASCETDRDSGIPSTDGNRSEDIDEDKEDSAPQSQSHWKAIRTLFTILTLFLALWGPYFVVLFMTATRESIARTVYIVTTWLAFTSYAVNPFVYGLLNRNIREAVVALYQRLKEGKGGEPQIDNEIGDNEDFFQFLERTSSVPNETIQSLDVKSLPALVEPNGAGRGVEGNGAEKGETNGGN